MASCERTARPKPAVGGQEGGQEEAQINAKVGHLPERLLATGRQAGRLGGERIERANWVCLMSWLAEMSPQVGPAGGLVRLERSALLIAARDAHHNRVAVVVVVVVVVGFERPARVARGGQAEPGWPARVPVLGQVS